LPPASWRKASSRHCMPNRNSASPAHSSSQPRLIQNETASRPNSNAHEKSRKPGMGLRLEDVMRSRSVAVVPAHGAAQAAYEGFLAWLDDQCLAGFTDIAAGRAERQADYEQAGTDDG